MHIFSLKYLSLFFTFKVIYLMSFNFFIMFKDKSTNPFINIKNQVINIVIGSTGVPAVNTYDATITFSIVNEKYLTK